MASAIIQGLANLQPRPALIVAEPDDAKREAFAAKGIRCTGDNREAVANASLVILAIKPQMAGTVLPDLGTVWSTRHALVSILAGTTTAILERGSAAARGWCGRCPTPPRHRPGHGRAVRRPPRPRHRPRSRRGAVRTQRQGAAPRRREPHGRDHAVSGSGPAYFFRFAEALHAAAVQLGFSADEAALLVATTGQGSWEYLLRSGFANAGKLREQVTKPRRTTAAALTVLDQGDFLGLIGRALKAAEQRGKELAAASG